MWPKYSIGIGIVAVCAVMTFMTVFFRLSPSSSGQGLGSFNPAEKSEWVEFRDDGSFSAKIKEDLIIDIPLGDPKPKAQFVRILIKKGIVTGKTIEGRTQKKGIPVKLMVFLKPHMLVGDLLDKKRDSMVPGIAKLLGALPNVVALVCYKRKEAWSVAPQLSGHGAAENKGLMKDLLKIDDVIDPEILAKF